MSTSKVRNNKLALQLATDSRYKFQKNGVIKKLGSDGKFRKVGTTRHGYNVISYKGTKVVTARAIVAKGLLTYSNLSKTEALEFLNRKIVVRSNGDTLNDSDNNIYITLFGYLKRKKPKRLTQKQKDRMVELFCEGFSVAKIARRFRRKVSRSHVSKIIKRELGVEV